MVPSCTKEGSVQSLRKWAKNDKNLYWKIRLTVLYQYSNVLPALVSPFLPMPLPLPFFCTPGIWETSGCVVYCQTLQHEQKQSWQPVLQRGSWWLDLHSPQTLPELETYWLWGSGNSLVSISTFSYDALKHNWHFASLHSLPAAAVV